MLLMLDEERQQCGWTADRLFTLPLSHCSLEQWQSLRQIEREHVYIFINIYKMPWQGAQLYGRDLDYNEEEPRQGLYSD